MLADYETLVNDSFDSRLVEVLYSIDLREDVKGIYLGTVRNTSDGHDTSGVEHRIERLMEEVGPHEVSWTQLFLGGMLSEYYGEKGMKFTETDRRHFELNGITAGRFFTKLVYDKLPIEWSTEGESKVTLSFAVDNDFVMNLVGEGTFDTAYLYDHEGADLDDDDPSESEIIYEMTFTAELLYCPISRTENK